MGPYSTSNVISFSPTLPSPLSALQEYLPASCTLTRWMTWLLVLVKKRPFFVHLTLETLGLESTVHCNVADESLSTLRGFSGPTSTRGKSEIKRIHYSNRECSLVACTGINPVNPANPDLRWAGRMWFVILIMLLIAFQVQLLLHLCWENERLGDKYFTLLSTLLSFEYFHQ